MKVVCIGGPADGKFVDVEPDRSMICWRVRKPLPLPVYNDCRAAIDPSDIGHDEFWYTPRTFLLFGKTIKAYVYNNLDVADSDFLRKITSRLEGR